MNSMLPANHVFIDYENVTEMDLTLIGHPSFQFAFFLGPQQNRLPVSLVVRLLKHPELVKLVQIEKQGRDALDFTLACYIGKAVAAGSGCFYHVISKDTGYDPMIEHLQGEKIKIARHPDFSRLNEIAAKAAENAKTRAAPPAMAANSPQSCTVQRAWALLSQGKNRPKKQGGLVNQLAAYFALQPDSAEITTLITQLIKAGHVTIDPQKAVSYRLKAA